MRTRRSFAHTFARTYNERGDAVRTLYVGFSHVHTSLQNSSFKKRTCFVSRASLARIGYLGRPTAGVSIMTSDTCFCWTRVRRGGPRSYLPHGHPSFGTFVFGGKDKSKPTKPPYPPCLYRLRNRTVLLPRCARTDEPFNNGVAGGVTLLATFVHRNRLLQRELGPSVDF
jgi:hypothetical protein